MNKKIFLGGLISLIAIFLGYLFIYEPGYSGAISQRNEPAIFAHRGYGDLGPDNALSSALRAMDDGYYGVDVDGQMTADNQLVIFHDLSVDRLTSGKGKVSSLTLDELRTLDLNESFNDDQFQGSYVSSFEDFVREVTPHGVLMVELKIPGLAKTGAEEEAVQIIQKYNAFDQVYLSSFNPLVLYRLEQLDSRVNTALIFMDTNWNEELKAEIKPEDFVSYPWALQQEWIRRAIRKMVKPDMLSINVEVSIDTRRGLIERGWPIYLWTIDDPDLIKASIADNPFAIISDQPARVREALESQ
jgi:glycerophosphoryl diester phosphodiesterase